MPNRIPHAHAEFVRSKVAALMADVADERIYKGSLDNRFGFHNLSLQPES